MNKTDKKSKATPDKNLQRIEKQSEIEERVKKGAEPKSGSNRGNSPLITDSGNHNKYQSGSPSHPMFAVDPELERKMAAQDVSQKTVSGAMSPKKSGRFSSKKKVARKKGGTPAARKKSSSSKKELPRTGAWDKKGKPKFAAPDDHQPDPL